MTKHMTADDARGALAQVEQGRQYVIDEFGMPRWYWWSLALGWIVLAVLTDLRIAWLTLVATVAFGAAHSTIFNYLAAGRHRTRQLSVRFDTVTRFAQFAVVGALIGLGVVTIIGALLAHADGAGHPVTIASIPVAVAIVLGGPTLMDTIRRHAARPYDAA